jgi:hypothetical protein
MRIPSPDEALIGLAERAMRPLQRQGVPLPAIRAPVGFVEPVGGALTGLMFLMVSAESLIVLMGVMFLAMAAVDAATAVAVHRRLSAMARSWGPDVAMRYAREALEARETGWPMRLVVLVTSVCAMAIATVAFRTGDPVYVLGGIGFFVTVVGRLANAYARCVLPEDAGGSRQAPLPAGA